MKAVPLCGIERIVQAWFGCLPSIVFFYPACSVSCFIQSLLLTPTASSGEAFTGLADDVSSLRSWGGRESPLHWQLILHLRRPSRIATNFCYTGDWLGELIVREISPNETNRFATLTLSLGLSSPVLLALEGVNRHPGWKTMSRFFLRGRHGWGIVRIDSGHGIVILRSVRIVRAEYRGTA